MTTTVQYFYGVSVLDAQGLREVLSFHERYAREDAALKEIPTGPPPKRPKRTRTVPLHEKSDLLRFLGIDPDGVANTSDAGRSIGIGDAAIEAEAAAMLRGAVDWASFGADGG